MLLDALRRASQVGRRIANHVPQLERPVPSARLLHDERQARCGDATFDAQPDVNGFVHCRARSGQFAGQFAPAACCLDACVELVEQGVDELPLECVLPLEEECAGADVDGNGICRTADGRFAKAACCMGIEGLAIQKSDDCRYAEFIGDDPSEIGCE